MNKVLSQTLFDVTTWLRNGEQALLNLILPAVGLWLSARYGNSTSSLMVVALAIFASSFTGVAISWAFDRRAGLMRFYAASPLGRAGFVVSRATTAATVATLQLLVLLMLSYTFGQALHLTLTHIAGLLLLSATGLSLAAVAASLFRAETVLAVANLALVAVAVSAFSLNNATEFAQLLHPVNAALMGTSAGFASCAVWSITSLFIATKSLRWE